MVVSAMSTAVWNIVHLHPTATPFPVVLEFEPPEKNAPAIKGIAAGTTSVVDKDMHELLYTTNVGVSKNTVVGMSHIAIPKIIHQTYKSRTLPTDYKLWREQCMTLNPTWTFKLWTDSDNREFVANVYPELLSLYDNYNANIKRIDMVRYLYLDTIGGMYMDLDFTCLKPFDESFDSIHEFTVAPQYKASYSEFANAWMASPPNSPVVKQIIQKLPDTKLLDVLSATGPVFLTTILKNENHDNWNELRFEEIYCQVWNDHNMCTSYENCRTKCPSAFTVSLWTHSWGHKKKERTWQRRKLELVHITKTGGSSLEFAASRAGIN